MAKIKTNSPQTLPLTLFAVLWAFAGLFHIYLDEPSYSGIVFAPFAVSLVLLLLNPSSIKLLAALALSQLALYCWQLPITPNHWTLTACTNLILLLAIVKTRSVPSAPIRARAIWAEMQLGARYLLAIVYFFAALAKLNTGFLNPETSCAVVFFKNVVAFFPAVPDHPALHYASIYGPIFVELTVPLLLIFNRLTILAVLVGLLFHWALALDMIKFFANFSSVMFALFVICLPEAVLVSIVERGKLFFGANPLTRSRLWRAAVLFLALLWLSSWFLASYYGPTWIYQFVKFLVFQIYAGGCLLFVIRAVCKSRTKQTEDLAETYSRLSWGLSVVLLLAILNGIFPYIGVKTRFSWQMYSNLTLEPAVSNHLFLPASPDVLGHLRDSALILASTDDELGAYAKSNLSLPLVAIEAAIARNPWLELTFSYRGNTVAITPETRSNYQFKTSWIERKLLAYHPLGFRAAEQCVW